jgi:hypothetical protein
MNDLSMTSEQFGYAYAQFRNAMKYLGEPIPSRSDFRAFLALSGMHPGNDIKTYVQALVEAYMQVMELKQEQSLQETSEEVGAQ